jgi:hypothetical protein
MTTEHYFTQTKQKLFKLIDELNLDFIYWFKQDDKIWQQTLSKEGRNLQNYFLEICSVNQTILNVLKKTQLEIYQGKLNNKYQYLESDFIVVDVILKIYTEFSNKKPSFETIEIQDLKQIIILQMENLFNEIERFPDDFATNIKKSPSIITTIKLDYYQLIYLALAHAKQQIIDLQLSKQVLKSINNNLFKEKLLK